MTGHRNVADNRKLFALVNSRYIFPTVFAKTSCMMNPLLYGLTNASLRRQFELLWSEVCCKLGRQHKPEHHDAEPSFRK